MLNFMGVIQHKIWYDLWKNKARTLQVVLIIAMGATAIGMIIGTRMLVIPNMQASWQSSNPAMMNFGVFPAIDENDLTALKRIRGVEEIEGRGNTTIEWRVHPDDDWTSGELDFRDSYPDQKLNKLQLMEGEWPQGRTFAIETGHSDVFGIPTDQPIYIRVDEKEYTIQFGGEVYNQLAAPAIFGGNAQFYTTRDRFGELTGDRDFTRFMARGLTYDEDALTVVADEIQDKLEKQGKDVFGSFPGRVSDPNKHFFQDQLDGLFTMLGVMGLLALILGLFLVYNTINAIISQQVDQIGIMKAIGGRTGSIFSIYLITVLIYGLLALLVSLPLGAIGAWGITSWLVGSFNADAGAFTISPQAMGAQVVVALLSPLLAAIWPIFSGARITVREAISTYGLNVKTGLIERVMAQTQRISRTVLVTISNTFRNKWRVILMQITLVLSALIFMMVISVRDSVVHTFDEILFSILNYDVNFALENEERISRIEELTVGDPSNPNKPGYPGIKAAEMWDFAGGSVRSANQPATDDDEGAFLFGVPLPTQLYGYQIQEGRWLLPEDQNAIVLNKKLLTDINEKLAEEDKIGVGDYITFKHDDKRETTWQVVGLLFDPILTASAHVSRSHLQQVLRKGEKSDTIWIQMSDDNPISEADLGKNLRAYYADNQVKVSPQRGVFGIADGATETGQSIVNQFNFIIILLAIMAVIIGLVGSIALSGALSLSVMERHREIGVMRAIGASSFSIARLFIGEGLILGWLSWLIAFPLSVPAGQLMLNGISSAFDLDLVYKYTLNGPILWFVIITVLSILASTLPARGATRVSVRESLAYQ
ncbi:MAG: ABC transporter permease [Chloroflexota bacterium]